MEATIEQVLNTPVPITFRLGEVELIHSFHEMTLLEQSTFRRKLEARARNEWLARLREVAGTIDNPMERRKMLAEAAQHEPDLELEIRRLVLSKDGIMWALQAAVVPTLTNEVFEKLNTNLDNGDALTQALKTVFGETKSSEEAKKEDEVNPPVPSPAV